MRRFAVMAAALAAMCISLKASPAAVAPYTGSMDDLFNRLSSANQTLSTGVFKCETRREQHPPEGRGPVEEQIKQFESELRSAIQQGTHVFSDKQIAKLEKEYGTTDYAKLLGNPAVQAQIENYVERSIGLKQRDLDIQSATRVDTTQDTLYLDHEHSVRLERTFQECLENGKASSGISPGRQDVVVANQEYSKLYTADVKAGILEHGISDKKSAYYNAVDSPYPLNAGRPSIKDVWNREDIKSVEVESTPEGEALRIVLVQPFERPGTGKADVMWVLPDKGYSVYRQESYWDGQLVRSEQYEDYKQLETGEWYPMKQAYEGYSSNLPAELLDRLKSGELSIGSAELLAAAKKAAQVRMRSERNVKEARLGVPIEPAMFEFHFPPGTTVNDQILAGRRGQPTVYKIETVDDESSQSKGLAVVLAAEAEKKQLAEAAHGSPSTRPASLNSTSALALQSHQRRGGLSKTLIILFAASAALLVATTVGIFRSRKPHSN